MKKLILLITMCFLALVMQAQRCAVLEFKAGVGISQADVDGISAIFTTYFRPTGYTMVERTQINKAIDEQGFQRSKMTESQMVRIGKILNVSKIVVGDVNVVMGQYNVDVRVINVESGEISATEGDNFAATSYRSTMQNIAEKLANKIAIKGTSANRNLGVYVDLGLPSGTLWKKIDESGYYEYDKALSKFGSQLPTKEQIEELIALCQLDIIKGGYKLTGPNGETIIFKSGLTTSCDNDYNFFTTAFWSSTEDDQENAFVLLFFSYNSFTDLSLETLKKCSTTGVRLVHE